MSNVFQEAEERYYALRGKFAAGRLDAEQFDAALRELMVEDAEGRTWMLGANSARWYFYDGAQWVEGEPSEADSRIEADPFVLREPESALVPVVVPAQKSRSLKAPAVLTGFVFLALIISIFLLDNQGMLSFAGMQTMLLPTRRVQVVATPHMEPVPVLGVASIPTRVNPAPIRRADAPVTQTPRPSPSRTFPIETLPPSPNAVVIPTATPLTRSADAAEDATATNDLGILPSVEAPGSNLPPDIYVTALRVSPPNQATPNTFTASFLNTTGGTRNLTWRIVLLNPSKQGRNKDFGESPIAHIAAPPGRSTFSIVHSAVTKPGPCLTLRVMAAWRRNDNARIFFRAPGGGDYATDVMFC